MIIARLCSSATSGVRIGPTHIRCEGFRRASLRFSKWVTVARWLSVFRSREIHRNSVPGAVHIDCGYESRIRSLDLRTMAQPKAGDSAADCCHR